MIILEPLIYVLIIALDLYLWLVVIAAVLSWLISFEIINTSNRVVYMIADFLYRITEPALRPIRRLMPNLSGIDISPVILIFIIYFLQRVLGHVHRSLFGM